MNKYNENNLGALSMQQLQKLNHQMKVKVAGNRARNNERIINLADLKAMDKNSTESIRNQFFKGSVQEINSVLWPFMFQSEVKFVEAGNEVVSKIQITAEAAFVVTQMQRVVYEYEDLGGGNFNLTYIDPENYTLSAKDLKYSLNDLSSERSLTDKAISIDSMGHCQKPLSLEDSPFYLNPNQTMEFRFSSEGNKSYFVSMLFKGYRIRIEDASLLNIPTVTL